MQEELLEIALSEGNQIGTEFSPSETVILQCTRPLIYAAGVIHWGDKGPGMKNLKDLKLISTSMELLVGHAQWLENSVFNHAVEPSVRRHPFPWEYHYEQVFLGLELDKVLYKFGERVLLYLKTEHSKSPVQEVFKCKGFAQRLQNVATKHIARNRAAALKWRGELTDWYEQYDTVQEFFKPDDQIGAEILEIMGEQRIKRSLSSYVESCFDSLDRVVALAKLA